MKMKKIIKGDVNYKPNNDYSDVEEIIARS